MWGVHRALEGSEESHKRSSLLKKSLSKRSMGRRRTQTLPKQVQTTYKWTSRSLNKAQKRTRARCLDKPPCKGRTISGTGVSCSRGPGLKAALLGAGPFQQLHLFLLTRSILPKIYLLLDPRRLSPLSDPWVPSRVLLGMRTPSFVFLLVCVSKRCSQVSSDEGSFSIRS